MTIKELRRLEAVRLTVRRLQTQIAAQIRLNERYGRAARKSAPISWGTREAGGSRFLSASSKVLMPLEWLRSFLYDRVRQLQPRPRSHIQLKF